jgi:hypothetical protein
MDDKLPYGFDVVFWDTFKKNLSPNVLCSLPKISVSVTDSLALLSHATEMDDLA